MTTGDVLERSLAAVKQRRQIPCGAFMLTYNPLQQTDVAAALKIEIDGKEDKKSKKRPSVMPALQPNMFSHLLKKDRLHIADLL